MLAYKKTNHIYLLFASVMLFVLMSLDQSRKSIETEEHKANEKVRQIEGIEKLEKIMKDNLILPEAPVQPQAPARFIGDIA